MSSNVRYIATRWKCNSSSKTQKNVMTSTMPMLWRCANTEPREEVVCWRWFVFGVMQALLKVGAKAVPADG